METGIGVIAEESIFLLDRFILWLSSKKMEVNHADWCNFLHSIGGDVMIQSYGRIGDN